MKLDKTNILMALEEGGYYFPKEFIFTRRDWEDLHETLTSFKKRVLKRRLSVEQAVKADGLNQCPFCDKFDVVEENYCTSCGKMIWPPEPHNADLDSLDLVKRGLRDEFVDG